MKFKYILFLYFFFFNLTNSLITLQIYSKTSKQENDYSIEKLQENNYKDIYSIRFYTNISIGNPEQKIPFLINFHSPLLYISNPSINGTYIHQNSNSFKFKNNQPEILNMYFDIIDTFYLRSDIFNLNNVNYTFKFILGLTSKNNSFIDNYIGLSPRKQFIDKLYPFLSQIKNNENIISNVFVINFDKSKNFGKIIFGGYPHDYEPKKYKIEDFRIIGEKDTFFQYEYGWELQFNYISFINYLYDENEKVIDEKIVFKYHNKTLFRVNIDANYISLNKDLSIQVEKIIENLYKNNCYKINKNLSNNYNYICRNKIDITKFPSLILSLEPINFLFELDYTDLFLKKNNYYFILLEFSDSYDKGEIGFPFLSKYNLVFHESENIIGFYIKTYDNGEYILFIQILIISIFINLLFIFFYLRRYFKRKNLKNIDYSYINDKKTQIDYLNPIKSNIY